MDFNLKNQYFIVTGVTSGFGKSVSQLLMKEGAGVIGVARREEMLVDIKKEFDNQFDYVVADITREESITTILEKVGNKTISGIFINAGGPPAKSFLETELADWDDAYRKLLRWKVDIVKRLIPRFVKQDYGRILFLESSSVKQPIENLVLSTSLRMSVVGLAKTISEELSENGITANVLAPGSHNTSALDRLIHKKAEIKSISFESAKMEFEKGTKVGFLGNPDDLASMAVWLLSPLSKFVTGQTISIAGGAIKSVFG
ncbi:MAG: SDR family oxidoreductase [Bacteroidales bacterium]|nr:SDR family oxidoreductase [Bacteroidales bacterium]